MNTLVIVLIAAVVLFGAYVFYGRWLANKWGIDPKAKTPAVEFNDGKDFVPTNGWTVFSHQFSSIAGAGPVTGAIQAAAFGWLPVLLWVLIGGVFFGAVADFGALYASVKNKGKSMGMLIEKYIGKTGRVWRETMHRIKDEYPEVEYTDMYVDNCAMQLVRNPGQFDVIVTGNLFGDILSDEASMITGSIGMLPSASMNESGKGMYEPIHGSAPDIAGKGIANPIATILSCAMMLRYSFGLKDEADAIETAVENVLNAGHRTADIAAKGEKVLSTSEMGALIREQL